VIKTLDKFSPLGPAGNRGISCRPQDHLGLLKRRQLMKVAQELKEAHIPWQIGFAEAPKHPQVWLEQGEQTLRSVLMHVTTRVFL